jgi:pilus assembly protein Flp/PilA
MKGDPSVLDTIHTVMSALLARTSNEDGQTMVEYAFLVAFIAVVVLVGVTALGTNLLGFFNSVAGQV